MTMALMGLLAYKAVKSFSGHTSTSSTSSVWAAVRRRPAIRRQADWDWTIS